MLYASVEGFLDVPLVGRFLVPPVRRAESGTATKSRAIRLNRLADIELLRADRACSAGHPVR